MKRPGGMRLHLRLGTRCNNRCLHCTVADITQYPDRDTESALAELKRGRRMGCHELVLMRGEPTIRPDILTLVSAARKLGYRHIQLQTNGRVLSYEPTLSKLLRAGVSFFEVSLYGDSPELHDRIARTEGALMQTLGGLRNLLASGTPLLVNIPVMAMNFERLPEMVSLLANLGVARLQASFVRPVRVSERWNLEVLARLSMVSELVRQAGALASDFGLVMETEGIPICHLGDHMTPGRDAEEDWDRHVISDLHIRHDGLARHRASMRPNPAACAPCVHRGSCPTTWADYLTLFGDGELFPIKAEWAP